VWLHTGGQPPAPKPHRPGPPAPPPDSHNHRQPNSEDVV